MTYLTSLIFFFKINNIKYTIPGRKLVNVAGWVLKLAHLAENNNHSQKGGWSQPISFDWQNKGCKSLSLKFFPLKAFPLTVGGWENSVITNTSTPESDECSQFSHPGIFIRLLIKCHFLTFSYTASHLPLEFTVGVLPPLFLWTWHQMISVKRQRMPRKSVKTWGGGANSPRRPHLLASHCWGLPAWR